MIMQLIAAMGGTLAFSILFSVPKKYYLICGLIGAMGWGTYLVCGRHLGEATSILAAALVVAFLSRLVSEAVMCPSPLFLIPGLFPLIPGAGIYWMTYYIVTDETGLAMDSGYHALKQAVAIVLAIVLIFELPKKCFTVMGRALYRKEIK